MSSEGTAMNYVLPFAAAAAFTVAGCAQETPAENTADALEEAAEQSTPEAANALEDAAEQVREANISDPAAADRALQHAGNAQAPVAPPLPPPTPTLEGNGQ